MFYSYTRSKFQTKTADNLGTIAIDQSIKILCKRFTGVF